MTHTFKNTLRCSECFTKFRCDDPWPPECPRCHVPIPGKEDDAPEIPAFLSLNTRRADNVYREMERGSEFRMQKASEMLGVPTSELGHMKITNLRDTKHPGDVAAVPPPPSPEFSRNMTALATQQAPVAFLNPMQVGGGVTSQEVQSGPYPNAGAQAIKALRDIHPSEVDPRQRAKVQCDTPALETTYPGYRRRA